MIRIYLGYACILCGLCALALALYGVYHFRFVLNRMHAAALVDTLALSLTIIGLMLLCGSGAYIPKLLLILLIQWIGSPIASHMVARLEVRSDPRAGEHMTRVNLLKEAEPPIKETTTLSDGETVSAPPSTTAGITDETAEHPTQEEAPLV